MKTGIWAVGLFVTVMACQQAADQTEAVRFLPIQLLEGYGPFRLSTIPATIPPYELTLTSRSKEYPPIGAR